MDKDDFKNHFVTTFLASWAAFHYADFCQRGLHHELENPPIEDAGFLAEKAWEKVKPLAHD